VCGEASRPVGGGLGLHGHGLRDLYQDLGAEHFTRRNPEQAAKRLIKRLENLGYAIEARPTTAGVSI
jgi:hypothetical protein